jgi:glyoxylase-like metal-dependent hydrolase (beta-lactamase superfamily II)
MSLVTTFHVGGLRCHALDAGLQRLDGGAMFGVVPKPLWSRRIDADDRNRIPLAMRCLLVEHGDGPVLIDTGIGNKEQDKFRDIYGVENAGEAGPTQLDDALAAVGFSAGDVRYVINTHLHFDHAGGNTSVPFDAAPDAAPQVAFTNATYMVQAGELDFGMQANERTAGSYLPKNFAPITEAERWRLLPGDEEILPGIRAVVTPGHVPHHQSILVTDAGETACFLGDLVPTTAHLPLPWIMGYDLEPLVTLESKRRLLGRAEAEGWILVFEHDPERGVGRAVKEGKSFGFQALAR